MMPNQSTKVECLKANVITVATNANNYGYLDTIGWDSALILTTIGTGSTSAYSFKTLALSEGTNSAAATAIPKFTGATTTSTSAYLAITKFAATPTVVRMNVDLTKRERYLRINAIPGTAAAVNVTAILSRGRQMPGSDAGSVTSEATY